MVSPRPLASFAECVFSDFGRIPEPTYSVTSFNGSALISPVTVHSRPLSFSMCMITMSDAAIRSAVVTLLRDCDLSSVTQGTFKQEVSSYMGLGGDGLESTATPAYGGPAVF